MEVSSMTQPNRAVTPADTMTMFRLSAAPDGTAVLTVISRDSAGQFWQTDYAMDPLLSYAFRGAVARELNEVPAPPPVTPAGLAQSASAA
jgi:hypothetical protein